MDIERLQDMAHEMITEKLTVRQLANVYDDSKSSIWLHLTTTLKTYNPLLYSDVRKHMDANKQDRARRGGESTRRKWKGEANSLDERSEQKCI
jgi:hypothetical protein